MLEHGIMSAFFHKVVDYNEKIGHTLTRYSIGFILLWNFQM